MKALVTGGSGFIGRHVVEKLIRRGDKVHVISRRPCHELQKTGVIVIQADLGNKESVENACQGIDCVFHIAALTGIWGKWSDFYKTNVIGTQNIISGCEKHGVRRLVYTSSPSVVYDFKDQINIDETVPYPKTYFCAYSETKAIAEKMVLGFNKEDVKNNKKLVTVALRPHLVLGPQDNHLIPRLLDRARRGKLIMVGDGTNKVDLTWIDNVVSAHLLAAEALIPCSPIAGEAFFISQGEPVVLWEWINQLLEKMGLPGVKKSISLAAAMKIGWLFEKIYWFFQLKTEPPMTRFVALQLATSHYFNISKAQKYLRYKPLVSLSDGMGSLVEYYKFFLP